MPQLQGWNCHMLFVIISNLFTTQVRDILKKSIPLKMPIVLKSIHEIVQNKDVNILDSQKFS